MGPTREYAAFAARTALDDVPDAVASTATRLLIESVAVTLLGGGLTMGRQLAAVTGWPQTAYAVPNGTDASEIARAAACNAALADVNDSAGGALATPIHPGKNLLPAAVTAWLASERPGTEVVRAAALGGEFALRLDAAIGLPHKLRGHYCDGTFGALGAAVAVGTLQRLSAAQLDAAVGTAALLAPATVGGAEMFTSRTRPLAMGHAAAAGVTAADASARGLTGPLGVLERRGGVATALSGTDDLTELVADLGHHWQLPRSYLKPYLGCRLTHAAREGLWWLQRQHGFTTEDVARVRVAHPAQDLPVIGHHAEPDGNAVAHSCSESYLLADVLVHGDLGFSSLDDDRLADEHLHAVARRVEVVEDRELTRRYTAAAADPTLVKGRPVELEVELADGGLLSTAATFAKGDPVDDLALSDDELTDKFVVCAGAVMDAPLAEELCSLLWSIEELPDARPVAALLRRADGAPRLEAAR